MNASTRTVTLIAVFTLAGMLMAGRSGPAPDAEDGIRFVDMQRCFDSYPPVEREMDRLRQELARSNDGFKAREAAMKESESELQLMDPSGAEYARKSFDLETARMSLERDKQFAFEQIQAERLKLFLRAYDEVVRVCGELGSQNGYGSIMILPGNDENLPQSLQVKVEALQNRAVLWANPAYDVTNEVIRLLK